MSKRFIAIEHGHDGILIHGSYVDVIESDSPLCNTCTDEEYSGHRIIQMPDKNPQIDCPECLAIIKVSKTYKKSELRE